MDIQYVEEHMIFLTGVGSRAYGIHTPESDYDQAGVMIPGPNYFFGMTRFEQFQGYPEDKTIYDIRKALRLISDGNPNMLDLLFVPDRVIIKMTPYWQKIMDNREMFISTKCRWTFSGYAFAQLNRIDTHRKFLLDPPKIEPTRKSFGLPAVSIFPTAQLKAIVFAALRDFIKEGEKENLLDDLDDVYSNYVMPLFSRHIKADRLNIALEYLQLGTKSQAKTLQSLGSSFIKDEYLEAAGKELLYYNARQIWTRFQEWGKNRNKVRAEMELKFGFDCKHAAHLIRLIRMCKEILETGKVNVDRTNIDAEELKAIRNGAWSYDKIKDYAKQMDAEAEVLYKKSTLPRTVDIKKMEALCVSICEDYYDDHWKYPCQRENSEN